jgi:hypothetical protein
MTDPKPLDPKPLLDPAAVMERVLLAGDLSKLTPADRVFYYQKVCESVGLNPLTRPFDYLILNGKLTLYAKRDATDQLRRIHGVSITIKARENLQGVYVVTANARDKSGREDESTGAVTITNLSGDALANALMKAETKAKRRVTLSICGLGMLDETEIETIPPTLRAEVAAKSAAPAPAAPEHYADWQKNIVSFTAEGIEVLQDRWQASPREMRLYTDRHNKQWWEMVKGAARKKLAWEGSPEQILEEGSRIKPTYSGEGEMK